MKGDPGEVTLLVKQLDVFLVHDDGAGPSLQPGQDHLSTLFLDIFPKDAEIEDLLARTTDPVMLERLRREFGAAGVANPKTLAPGKHIRVCTLNAATGLESPIVFVIGMHRMCEAEQSVRLSENERAELIRDNTRKLYMAFTREDNDLVINRERPVSVTNPMGGLFRRVR